MIRNKINGKAYIGRSVNIKRRWAEHRRQDGSPDKALYKAFCKYGLDNFEFTILEECSKEESFEKEMLYIKLYDSYNSGYNETFGGEDGAVSMLTKDLDIIFKLLKETDLSMKEIGSRYHVTTAFISLINKGERCYSEKQTYPIRRRKKIEKKVNKKRVKLRKKVKPKIIKKKTYPKNNYCLNCGIEISSDAKYCQSCFHIKNRKGINRPNKDKLITSIVKTSFRETAKQYNVSDNTIRKWLKAYGEPYRIQDIYKKYVPEKLVKKEKVERYLSVKDENPILVTHQSKRIIFENILECVTYFKKITPSSNDVITSSIRRVLTGKRKTYLGYTFQYIED